MSNLYFTDKITKTNPFTVDGTYADNWVGLSITENEDYEMMTFAEPLFHFKVNQSGEGWSFRVMDFISYHTTLGVNIIYEGNKSNYEIAKTKYRGHSIRDDFLRPYEPPFLVHSTTPSGYKKIMKDYTLKSWNLIKQENGILEDKPIGDLLGDPSKYRDYVMLGSGFWTEIVVCSRENGAICMDANCEYTPGGRFYFDTLDLIRKGLLVRDGLHYKVKDQLPLSNMLFCATTNNVIVEGSITPKSFADAADKMFLALQKGE